MKNLRMLSLAAAIAAFSVAQADDLGIAGNFNEYVLGNANQAGSDTTGTAAIGGNADFVTGGYGRSFNSGSFSTYNGYSLIVGGTLSNTNNTVNGSVYSGVATYWNNPSITSNLVSGGSINLSGYGTVSGNVQYGSTISNPHTTVHGTTTHASSVSPVNFTTENAALKSLSSEWYHFANTGTYKSSYGVTLTGTDSKLDVFNITAAQLAAANGYGLTFADPTGATVLVNVIGNGNALTLQNFAFNLGSTSANKLMFNFTNVSTLNLSGLGWEGSVLAANSDVQFNNGQFNGTLVAGSLEGVGELHDVRFNGNVVPEPASFGALGLGLIGILARRKRA